jgi:hypothetical protein
MATFAVIENNIVTNTILAETLADAKLGSGKTCVEYTELNLASIGWTYDGTTNTFTAPIETPVSTDETTPTN